MLLFRDRKRPHFELIKLYQMSHTYLIRFDKNKYALNFLKNENHIKMEELSY